MNNLFLKLELFRKLQEAAELSLQIDDADGVLAKMTLMRLICELKADRSAIGLDLEG